MCCPPCCHCRFCGAFPGLRHACTSSVVCRAYSAPALSQQSALSSILPTPHRHSQRLLGVICSSAEVCMQHRSACQRPGLGGVAFTLAARRWHPERAGVCLHATPDKMWCLHAAQYEPASSPTGCKFSRLPLMDPLATLCRWEGCHLNAGCCWGWSTAECFCHSERVKVWGLVMQ